MGILSSLQCLINPISCAETSAESILQSAIPYILIAAVSITGAIGVYYAMELEGEKK